MTQAYPLVWPEGWPRTAEAKRRAGNQFKTTFDIARRQLQRELSMLGAKDVVISSWLAIRADGNPYADQARRRIPDPGVAIYFTLKGKQMVMARDAYTNVHENLRSIGLAVEALRGLERHGGGTMMDRAFGGFAALPPPDSFNPWEVLGLSPGASREQIEGTFRTLSRMCHPDVPGGSTEAFQRLERARREALAA